ncbi:MAG: HlyD family secretion protein [Humisphaera sp.]|nr:HlyD family secretion protein [Humisphaera sp.]
MKILITVVITLALAGALTGVGMKLTGKSSMGGDAEQETAVRIEKVSRGDLVEIVSAPGQIQPKTKVSISAKTTARIMELPFDEGMEVKKDQIVVQLDSKDLEAQLKAVESRRSAEAAQIDVGEARLKAQQSQIESAKIQLAEAQRTLKRQKELLATQDVAQFTVDEAQARVDQLQAQLTGSLSSLEADRASLTVQRHQLEAAAAEILRAKDNLSYTTIVSPIDGIVTRMNAKVGEMVVTGTMNNMGTVILELSDLSEMQVDAQVDEQNIASVKAGQKAKVRISAFPDQMFDGVVKLVGLDIADARFGNQNNSGGGGQQGRWYRAKVVVDTSNKRIPAGLSADVDIETQRHEKVIRIPTQAVMGRPIDELPPGVKERPEVDKNKQLATIVFLFVDGKAKITPVTLGASDMTHTQITSGLSDNDRLIIGPYKILPGLKDGQKVKEDTTATTKSTTQSTTAATSQRATTTAAK